jgi:hypothetical protein
MNDKDRQRTLERRRPAWLACLAGTLGVAACATTPPVATDTGVGDTGQVAVEVGSPDVGTDTVAPDTGEDVATPPDVAIDLGTDTAASFDAPPDLPSTPDVAVDRGPVDAGCGATWPSCDARPAGATASTILELWAADPSTPSFRWVSGVVVTGISRNGCTAGTACQIIVQDPAGGSTLESVAHRAIKVFVSAATASRFVDVRVGDRVDVAASAWRYTVGGQHELLLQVADSCTLRGCMARTGTGTVTPALATLAALGSVNAYESTYGPVLVRLEGVGAATDATTPLTSTTGGMYVLGASFDGGLGVPVSLSPFFLPGSQFIGYSAGQRLRFTSVVGVFGMFIPSTPLADGGLAKYLEVYPRTTGDLTLM